MHLACCQKRMHRPRKIILQVIEPNENKSRMHLFHAHVRCDYDRTGDPLLVIDGTNLIS
jgi:hypothetical protein